MALISCPQCGKKISDKAGVCSFCDFQLDKTLDREAVIALTRARNNKKIQSLSNQSLIAVLLCLIGFYLLTFKPVDPESIAMLITRVALGVGLIWYIINRIRLLMLKQANKNL